MTIGNEQFHKLCMLLLHLEKTCRKSLEKRYTSQQTVFDIFQHYCTKWKSVFIFFEVSCIGTFPNNNTMSQQKYLY